jgi:hypothetical protein
MTTKQDLHRLVDELPDAAVATAARVLRELKADEVPDLPAFLRDAPWDDESIDAEEAAGVREALEDIRQGRLLSHEQARKLLLGDG